MRYGILAAVVFIFATMTFLSVTLNGASFSATDNETMSNVTGIRQIESDSSAIGTVLGIVSLPLNWIRGLVNMVAWNYSFLDNEPGQYFKWIIGAPLSAVALVMVAVVFIGVLIRIL